MKIHLLHTLQIKSVLKIFLIKSVTRVVMYFPGVIEIITFIYYLFPYTKIIKVLKIKLEFYKLTNFYFH
jgi:hypothetical protein